MLLSKDIAAKALLQQQKIVEKEHEDDAWRKGYILREAGADPSTRPRLAPHLNLLEGFLQEEAKRVSRVADERTLLLREYLAQPDRAAAVRYKDTTSGPVDARWRWGLLRHMVNSLEEKRARPGLTSMMMIHALKKQAQRMKVKRGLPPPMPAPVPPPFVDPAQAFEDLLLYQKKIKDYLGTTWMPETPQLNQSVTFQERSLSLSLNRSAPLPSIAVKDREMLTSRTKHAREKAFGSYVRAKAREHRPGLGGLSSMACSPMVRQGAMSPARSRTDSALKRTHIVDFSFMSLATLEGMFAVGVEPRGTLATNIEKVKNLSDDADSSDSSDVDLPTKNVGEIGVIKAKGKVYAYKQEARSKANRLAKRIRQGRVVNLDDDAGKPPAKQYMGTRLSMSNNALSDVDALPVLLRRRAVSAQAMTHIDLSHNRLAEVPACLTAFPCLRALHFHGNLIADVSGLQHLLGLARTLTDFTLHGNPLEQTCDAYSRRVLLVILPSLKQLNFSTVIETERDTARFILRTQKDFFGRRPDSALRTTPSRSPSVV